MRVGWVVFLCVVMGCIAGFAGLTAGINLNPSSTVRFVPNWGSLGDWVSGVGALMAVATTLWLSEKQRRENTEKLVIEQTSRDEGLLINIVSSGNRPSFVKDLHIESKNSDRKIKLASSKYLKNRFPAGRIDFGEMVSVLVLDEHRLEIAKLAADRYGEDFSSLMLVVSTSLGRFLVPLDSTYVSYMSLKLKYERQHQEWLASIEKK